MLQEIFSVKNDKDGKHKILTLFGFKIKFKRKIKKACKSQIIEAKSKSNAVPQAQVQVVKEEQKVIFLSNYKDDVKLVEKCPLCGANKYIVKRKYDINTLKQRWVKQYNFLPIPESYSDKELERKKCLVCGLDFYNYEIPDTAEFYEKLTDLHPIYSKEKWDYDIASQIVYKCQPNNLLDIGAGYGYFLDKIKNCVQFVEASEFNPLAITELKRKGYVVNDKELSQINKKFDFVTAFQVLEHIEEPKNFIADCVNLLNDNGFLLLITPNPDGELLKYNPGILELPPHHCIDISKTTFEYIAKEYNLNILEYQEQELEFWVYMTYLQSKFNLKLDKKEAYQSYAMEKNSLVGKSHMCLLQKKVMKNEINFESQTANIARGGVALYKSFIKQKAAA